MTQLINALTKGISDNYVSMMETCDLMIMKGEDAAWWQNMKGRLMENKIKVDNSLIPTHE